MGRFRKHRWKLLCCRLCEKRAGMPRRYARAALKRETNKEVSS